MNNPEPELPPHLYIEIPDPDSSQTSKMLDTEKLVAWSRYGRGNAIDEWCRQVCARKITAIYEWEEDRHLQLEENWISHENDEDDDDHEHRYHQACEEVSRMARQKRQATLEQNTEHKSAIEKLVEEARGVIEAHQPPEEDHFFDYVLVTSIVVLLVYVLIN